MDIGHRSRLSLCQLMDAVLSRDECSVIFRKYSIQTDDIMLAKIVPKQHPTLMSPV